MRAVRPDPAPPARRRRRSPGRVPTALVLLAALLTTGAVPARAASTRPPGAVADARLDGIIHTEQLELVDRVQTVAVLAAGRALAVRRRTLALDQATLARDRHDATDASAVEATATHRVAAAVTAVGVATGEHRGAVAAEDLDRRRLETLAIGLYTGGAEVTPGPGASLGATQAAGDAAAELGIVTSETAGELRSDTTRATVTGTDLLAARDGLGRDRAALAADESGAAHAAAALATATGVESAAAGAVTAATAGLAAARRAEAGAVTAFDGPEGTSARPVPTILGRSAMTAPEIVSWFDSAGYTVATRATIAQLAGWYVSEGRAEGVRGDIAFAQAIVETGEFDSPDAVRLNNYAGVGHCDSCSEGLRFASALDGVRSQIQLLRTYADPTLTSGGLPSPPPVAALAPQYQSARGCCRTWNSLTGVWATDTHYGTTILDVYAEMLAYAVSAEATQAPAG